MDSSILSLIHRYNGEMICQGAEAVIFKGSLYNKDVIIKHRLSKKYRHPIMDEKINYKRIKDESKIMSKLKQNGIDTPSLYFVDTVNRLVFMEYIHGITVKQFINDNEETLLNLQNQISLDSHNNVINIHHDPPNSNDIFHYLSYNIAKIVSDVHRVGIVHGDLTTSNMIKRNENDHIVLIDFGLSSYSSMIEERAVDLYVLERSFLSTHPNFSTMFKVILYHYQKLSDKGDEVISKLNDVRMRGRKKVAFG